MLYSSSQELKNNLYRSNELISVRRQMEEDLRISNELIQSIKATIEHIDRLLEPKDYVWPELKTDQVTEPITTVKVQCPHCSFVSTYEGEQTLLYEEFSNCFLCLNCGKKISDKEA
jgi:hypothetical protein